MLEKLNKYQERRNFQQRLWVAGFFVFFCFSLLFARFVWLQIMHHEQFSEIAKTNRVKILRLVPSRGSIVDRNGVVLAYNIPSYTVEIKPAAVKDVDALIQEISQIVPVSEREIRRFKQAVEGTRFKFISVPLRWGLNDEQVAKLSVQLYRFPGVEINMRFIRRYPLKDTACHVVGYINRITEADKRVLEEQEKSDNYQETQDIGRVGVEASYEQFLHGVEGVAEVEITSSGRLVRHLREAVALPGKDIRLTIDIRLQRLVEELFGERRGAFVAIDPRNGEVLALVSKPTFDPNLFIDGFDQESWDQLNDELSRPLFHRAIGGTYPIGSTYKPFMALAGLQTGTRTIDNKVTDKGVFELASRRWRSSQAGRSLNVSQAIAVSNNYYFYSLAYEMGVSKIAEFMKPWGFGQLTGIDLPGEVRGVLPTPEWKRQAYQNARDRRWYDGDTVNLGIGQGYNRFTMIQLGSALAALVNQGVRYTPHVLQTSYDVVRGTAQDYAAPALEQMHVDPVYLQVIREAMKEVPRKGTASQAFAGAAYESGGKTGTAQASSVAPGTRYDKDKLEEYKRDHSLYIAFAPADNPTIVVAIIVENAGFGARSAVPIVRRALDYHLLGVYPSAEDIQAVQKGYAGPPKGTPRTKESYDIIPAEWLVRPDVITHNAQTLDAWREQDESNTMGRVMEDRWTQSNTEK